MSEAKELVNQILHLAVEHGASDVHLKSHKPAVLRLHGHLQSIDMEAVKPDTLREFIERACPRPFLGRWHEESQIDFSYVLPGAGRFRVNAFYQRSLVSMVFRHVNDTPPNFRKLNQQPETFQKLCSLKDGIILVCGPTGSGKSSTLAAMLDWINHNYDRHIVTLEDPIEFTYTDDKSIFNQREIGIDAPDFAMGLKAVLRQDPDIILIGEMRDAETFRTAISAAETGHLVFGTLHSATAQQSIQRLFEFFPPEQQENMRRQIASCVKALITQRLIPAMEGGRVPAVEMMVVDQLGRRTIEEGAYDKINGVIEASREAGSRTFNNDLYRLVKDGIISKAEALHNSPNPNALEMNLKGIFLSAGGIVG